MNQASCHSLFSHCSEPLLPKPMMSFNYHRSTGVLQVKVPEQQGPQPPRAVGRRASIDVAGIGTHASGPRAHGTPGPLTLWVTCALQGPAPPPPVSPGPKPSYVASLSPFEQCTQTLLFIGRAVLPSVKDAPHTNGPINTPGFLPGAMNSSSAPDGSSDPRPTLTVASPGTLQKLDERPEAAAGPEVRGDVTASASGPPGAGNSSAPAGNSEPRKPKPPPRKKTLHRRGSVA